MDLLVPGKAVCCCLPALVCPPSPFLPPVLHPAGPMLSREQCCPHQMYNNTQRCRWKKVLQGISPSSWSLMVLPSPYICVERARKRGKKWWRLTENRLIFGKTHRIFTCAWSGPSQDRWHQCNPSPCSFTSTPAAVMTGISRIHAKLIPWGGP